MRKFLFLLFTMVLAIPIWTSATTVSYLDADGNIQTLNDGFTLVENATTEVMATGYYVVGADYNNDGEINAADATYATENSQKTNFTSNYLNCVNTDVKLILVDGFTLTLEEVVSTVGSAKLTFYGQEGKTGLLVATSGSFFSLANGSTMIVNGVDFNLINGTFYVDETSQLSVADYLQIFGGNENPPTTLVANDDNLVKNLKAYKYINFVDPIVNAVKKIDSIGTVEYTAACKAKIDLARSVYNALNEGLQSSVSNYTTLTSAETTYKQLEAVATAVEAIEAIGEVTYTDECKAKIDAARSAYDALSEELKENVTNYVTLTYAEKTYVKLKPFEVSYVDADGTTKTIDNGSLEITLLSSSDGSIVSAGGYFVVGADYNDDGVINATDAIYAEANDLPTAFTISVGAMFGGDGKLILVDGFSLTIEGSLGINNLIIYEQAEGTGTLVSNGGVLLNKSSITVNGGRIYFQQDAGASPAVSSGNNTSIQISRGELYFTAGSFPLEGTTITVAENMQVFGGNENPPTTLIANNENLTDSLKSYSYIAIVDKSVEEVKAKIDAIGTVEYTTESKAKIDAARSTYDSMTVAQQALVTNYTTLTTAETTYEQLKAVATVVEAIEAIGEVTYTDECKAKIDAARSAYDALSEELKENVTNYETLTAAEATYEQLIPLLVSYVDADGTTKTIDKKVETITLIDKNNPSLTWNNGYYVVGCDYNGDSLINAADAVYATENGLSTDFTIDAFSINGVGDVKLILSDGFTLTVNKGIDLNDGTKLTLYRQEAGTGLLSVTKLEIFLNSSMIVNGGKANVTEGNISINKTSSMTVNGGEVNVSSEKLEISDNSSTIVNGGEVNVINDEIYVNSSSSIKVDGGEVTSKRIDISGYSSMKVYDGEVNIDGGGISFNNSTIYVANNMLIYGGNDQTKIYEVENNDYLASQLSGYSYVTMIEKAVSVEVIINAIGTVSYTDECKARINAAREAYNALDEELKSSVSNYAKLTTAETTYEHLKVVIPVVEKINAIGTVAYTTESKALIDTARSAYDALTDDQKALVTNYETLTAAETTYEQLKPLVVSYVDADGNTQTLTKGQFTLLHQEEVSDIALDENSFYVVGADYNNDGVIDAADAELEQTTHFTVGRIIVNFPGTDGIANLILADGFTLTADFVSLSNSNLAIYGQEEGTGLLEAGYFDIYSESSLTMNGGEINTTSGSFNLEEKASLTVNGGEVNLIGESFGIDGTSTVTVADNMQIFGGNSNPPTTLIANDADLATAMSGYNYVTIIDKSLSVVKAINAIDTVTYTDECKAKIDAAREAYDELTDDQQALVSNYATLTKAEETYSNLTIASVVAKINAIGKVTYTDESKAKIDEAREAYNQLSEAQKALVTNYTTLTKAEETYEKLKTDALAAEAVEAKIDSIGTVSYTAESKAKIDAAREAYDALTTTQQALVNNYTTLTEAEETYPQLKPLAVSYEDADGTTKTIDKKVDAITLIDKDNSSQTWNNGYYVVGADYNDDDVINAADATYATENGLTTNFAIKGKITVTDEAKLILADGFTLTVGNGLSLNSESKLTIYGQEEETGSLSVTSSAQINHGSMIVNGGSLSFNDSNITLDNGQLEISRGKFNFSIGDFEFYASEMIVNGGEFNLSMGYVLLEESTISVADSMLIYGGNDNPPTTIIANSDLSTQLIAEPDSFGYITITDKSVGVVRAIDSIGTVVYTPECKTKIDAARSTYNALTTTQKGLVSNYATLTDAEESYNQLKIDNEAAAEVVAKINEIGKVEYAEESKAKIDEARDAYDELSKAQQTLVANYTTLTEAEKTYNQLKTDALAAEAVEAKIESIGTVEYTAESKAKIDAAREAYNELSEAQQTLVDNYATLTEAEATYKQLESETTLVEEVISNPINSAYKIIKEGRVLIVKDGAMYTLNGQKVE